MKIVILCHFSNLEFNKLLSLRKGYDEFAPWIPNLLRGFENRTDTEVFVIAPHFYLKRQSFFTLRNINYFFIPVGIPYFHSPYPYGLPFDVATNYYFYRMRVKKLVNKIQPDVINLIGAENAYYASSILQFKKKYPVAITIQGFISEYKIKALSFRTKHRSFIEKKILKVFNHYIGEMDSKRYISLFNKDFNFYKAYFPINEDLAHEKNNFNKVYDCIYFGRLDKLKGTEDFIQVIDEIKKVKPDIKGIIVGPGEKNIFVNLADELGCRDNIHFPPFCKDQKELFDYVRKSKVFLAPSYFDRLSATIREAMFLKVPIVAYATGGIPYVNENDENIILVKTGDYKEMAKKTLELLNNKILLDNYANKSYIYAKNEFSLSVNIERMLQSFEKTIKTFRKNK